MRVTAEAGLPRVEDLSQLEQLDRHDLHVFVTGPGKGEGVAIALPGRGWILIDSCSTPRGLPVLTMLDRFQLEDDPIHALVLTHPHEDHADGFADLLDARQPETVVIAGPSSCTADDMLSGEAAMWMSLRSPTFAEQKVQSTVAAALERIEVARRRGTHVVVVCDGCALRLPSAQSRAEVWVRAPSDDDLHAFYKAPIDRSRLLRRANRYSIVLEVSYGQTCALLGGDMITAGWTPTLDTHPHLTRHLVLKVPHHGGTSAHHEGLLTRGTGPRAWLLSPHNTSQLPREPDLRALLAVEPALLLSALSASTQRHHPHPPPGRLTLEELATATARARGRNAFEDGAEELRPLPMAPSDPVWCVAVDDHGNLAQRWRGSAAVEVVG